MLGKLTPDELRECVLSVIKKRRKEVISGSEYGVDSAVIKSDDLILLTTDPITGGKGNCGSLAVNVCCNDIAAAGGEPVAMLVTLLAPEDAELSDIKKVMTDIEREAEKLNVEIIGGHSEFTDAVRRMIVSATVVGIKKKKNAFVPIDVGQSIIVTKTLGLEGTSVILDAFSDRVSLFQSEYDEARCIGDSLSVVNEGRLCIESGAELAAMHDITEGGIIGALCEVMHDEAVGAEIDLAAVPFLAITKKLCSELSVDPYRLLSSGSMLIITPQPEIILQTLRKNGISACVIGKTTSESGVFAVSDGKKERLSVQPDEIYRLFKEE